MKTKFYRAATAEPENALDWYASRSPMVEAKFAGALEKALTSIETSPARYVKLSRRHRACRVIGFPYQLIYRVEGDVLVIVAVAHTSQRPGYWIRRK